MVRQSDRLKAEWDNFKWKPWEGVIGSLAGWAYTGDVRPHSQLGTAGFDLGSLIFRENALNSEFLLFWGRTSWLSCGVDFPRNAIVVETGVKIPTEIPQIRCIRFFFLCFLAKIHLTGKFPVLSKHYPYNLYPWTHNYRCILFSRTGHKGTSACSFAKPCEWHKLSSPVTEDRKSHPE